MQFEQFERRAWNEWDRIPDEYRQGIDGLVIERAAQPHPTLPDIYTLGECRTESYPSDFGGPDTIRSVVVLYYGSFFRLSRQDPSFDWDVELWETITHELQHHLESLAADDALVDMDYAADENFKRYEGEPFDPFFYRRGAREDGSYRVDDEYFVEVPLPSPAVIPFVWRGTGYEVDAPAVDADVVFVTVADGVHPAPPALHLVLVRPTGWRDALRSLFGRRALRSVELEAVAREAADAEQET